MADTVPFINPETKQVQNFDPALVPDLVRAGFRPASPVESHHANMVAAEDNPLGMAKAAGIGAARTTTMGLSDVALGRLGQASTVNAITEANPVTTGAAEVGSMFIPVAGELNATRLLGEAARGAVERGAGKLLATGAEKVAGKVAGKVVGAVARGAAEAPVWTAQQYVTESALGDPTVAAEHILSNLGTNALLFGGAEGVGKLLGEATKPAWSGLKDAATKLDGKLREIYPEVPAEGPRVGVSEPTGPGPQADPRIREAKEAMDEAMDKAKSVRQDLAGVRDLNRQELLKDVPIERAHAQAADVMAAGGQLLDRMQAGEDMFSKSVTDGLRKQLDGLAGKMSDAASSHDIYQALDDMKGKLQDLAGFSKMGPPSPAAADAINAVKSFARDVRGGLEKADVWGEAGAAQAEINGAFSAEADARRNLWKAFGEKVGRDVEASPAKLKSLLTSEGGSGTDIKRRLFQEWVDSLHGVADVGDKYAARVGQHAGDFDRDALRALLDRNQRAAESLGSFGSERAGFEAAQSAAADDFKAAQAREAAKDATGKHGGLGGTLEHAIGGGFMGAIMGGDEHRRGGAVLGAILGGHGIGKAIKLVGMLGEKEAMAVRLSRIEELAQKSSRVMDRHIDAIARVPEVGSKVAARGLVAGGEQRRDLEDIRAEMDRVRELAGNPENMMSLAGATSEKFQGVAPTVGQAVAAGQASTVGFLASKAPPDTVDAPLGPIKVPVSGSQLYAWDNYLQTSKDPVPTVLTAVHDGTLNDRHMETMQAIYPGMLQTMQTKTMDKIMANPAAFYKLPRGRQTSISKLTGVPVAHLSSPQAALSTQNVYASLTGPKAKAPSMSAPSGGVAHLSSAFEDPLGSRRSRIR